MGVGHGGRSMCLLSILPALASLYQTELPYHINKVDSNDVLYAGDPEYIEELDQMVAKVISLIIADFEALKKISDQSARQILKSLSLKFLNHSFTLVGINSNNYELFTKVADMAKSSGATRNELQSIAKVFARE